MYQIENTGAFLRRGGSRAGARIRLPQVGRNVLLLGLTSFFTDISSEMVATILPLYLVYTLRLTPFQYGVVDGVHLGAAALVRVAGGLVADRWRRHKEVAVAGYALSALCKPAFLAANAWSAITGVVLAERLGKGIRTAPRDALISLSAPKPALATAFGVHRALDTGGAMLGPLVAFGILAVAPRAFDAVFIVSFCVALVGLGVLVLFVDNRPAALGASPREPVRVRAALQLLRARRFRSLVLVAGGLGLATMSDGFVYMALQRRLELDMSVFPLLYVGAALVYMLLALPVGRLADAFGRRRVFLGGYGLLLLVYAALLLPDLGVAELVGCLVLFGAYYAATEGVLMALGSSVLPEDFRASGLALLVTSTSIARLLASVLFGALWTWVGVEVAVASFAVGLGLAMAFAWGTLRQAGDAEHA